MNTKNIAASTQRQVVDSLRLFYKEVYSLEKNFTQLIVSQRENKIPEVLTVSEVKKILTQTTNIKHKAFLSLLYCCSLRI